MDVGMAVVFQGVDPTVSDYQVYQNDIRLGMMAEELGFQSIWGIEHHFTDYTMCPDPVQFLSYFAAKSEKRKAIARHDGDCAALARSDAGCRRSVDA